MNHMNEEEETGRLDIVTIEEVLKMSRNNDDNIWRTHDDDIYGDSNNKADSLTNKSSGYYLISLIYSI